MHLMRERNVLTGVPWQYVKVPQLEWNKLQPSDFAEVELTFGFAT